MALSMRAPETVYVSPGIRPVNSTTSTMVITPLGSAVCWPSTVAVVPMLGCSVKMMVCPSSSISSWLEISVSPWKSVSNTTTDVPSSSVASKVKSTSTVPLGSAGVNVASDVTCSSPTSRGSPVDLSMSTPFKVYSWPAVRPEYSTVSVIVICSVGWAVFAPSMVAVVRISGCPKVTVWPSSLISAWDATTFSS